MDFMEQIELWNRNNEHKRIIEAIEALLENGRPPQLVSALARAYNNIAEAGDTPLFEKAIALLESVEDELQDDPTWNFRMAYAYYYLDQEGPALHYFERAMELNPGDAQTQEFIDDCRDRLALPLFEKPFRLRTAEGWASFLAGEAELCSMIETKTDSGRLMERAGELLSPAFTDISFQVGFNGDKYELVLTPEGSRAKLFQLVYFQQHAPAEVLERWNILVGRQPSNRFCLQMLGQDISAEDVLVWVEALEDGRISLALYCEKLLPLLKEDEGEAYWFLSVLLDQTIGDLSAMDLVEDCTLLETPAAGPAVSMDCLVESLQSQGLQLIQDSALVLEHYSAYEMGPDENQEADLRLDVFAGMTRCPQFINEYLQGNSHLMDYFHQDGVVAGFFYYPLDGFSGENRGKLVLDFRENVEAAILQQAGNDAVTFTGGASGIYYGYLDFIAWDLDAVLDTAANVFEQSPIPWAAFHTFRRDVGGVTLKKEPESAAK